MGEWYRFYSYLIMDHNPIPSGASTRKVRGFPPTGGRSQDRDWTTFLHVHWSHQEHTVLLREVILNIKLAGGLKPSEKY